MILKAAGEWLGTVVGKVVAGVLLILTIILIWKWQSVYDHARGAWWGLNNAQAVAHTANADTALTAAKKDSMAGAAATAKLDAVLVEPGIRNNPGAQRVGTAAKHAISAKNSEIRNLKTAVKETKAAAASYKAAGEKPVPRIQPYADIGYTVSLAKRYGVPIARVGATYRIVSWVHVQGELSYEPPPTISQTRMDRLTSIGESDFSKPEIRATLTAHFQF